MTYRGPTGSSPLILSLPQRVLAVDPATGAKLWETALKASARRLFVVGPNLLACCAYVGGGDIHCIQMSTGHVLGHVDLGFAVTGGLVRGDRLFVASNSAAACLSADGHVIWRALTERGGKGIFEASDMVCRDASGAELWRIDVRLHRAGDNVGLVLEDLIAQPDQRD